MSNPLTNRPAIAVATALCLFGTGCQHSVPLTPISEQVYLIFDVSGSTAKAVDGYAARAERVIADQPDGTIITTSIADGASSASACIPRKTTLKATGNNPTTRSDSLAAQQAGALATAQAQIACGKRTSAPGSDLIGSLLAADARLDPGVSSIHILLFSDGLQSSADLKLTRRVLTDPAKRKQAIKQLRERDLVPAQLSGADFCLTDPGVDTPLTAAESQGVLQFWRAYARAGAMSFHVC